jgi:hypothetical protein
MLRGRSQQWVYAESIVSSGMHVQGMKSMVASLLALLLLCGASWTSVCGLSCQLHQAKMVCAPTAMSMVCAHCHHTHHQDAVTTACAMMDCSATLPLQFRGDEGVLLSLANLYQVQTVQVVPAPTERAVFASWRRNPPGKISGFHPLLVSLRV